MSLGAHLKSAMLGRPETARTSRRSESLFGVATVLLLRGVGLLAVILLLIVALSGILVVALWLVVL